MSLRDGFRQGAKQQDCPGLGERLVVVPAFRGLHAARATCSAGAGFEGLQSGLHPRRSGAESPLRATGSARYGVMHDDSRPAGVRMRGSGQPAQIPAIACGEEGKEPDGGVFGPVEGTGKVRAQNP